MRRLVPIRGCVLCKKVSGGTETACRDGISFKRDTVDIYRLRSLPEVSPEEEIAFKPGDLVMSNSTGDEIEINPGETVYLFKIENLMCKVDYDEKQDS